MTSIASQQKDAGGPRVFIGYVKRFEYLPGNSNVLFGGHPKEGRLYRIIQSNGGFGIYVGKEEGSKFDGIELGFSLCGTYQDKWSFDIEELTEDNILDFDIDPQDLTNLGLWKDSENADLWGMMKANKPIVISMRKYPAEYEGNPVESALLSFDEYLQSAIDKALEMREATNEKGERYEGKDIDLIEEGAMAFNKISDKDKQMAEVICGLLKYIAGTYDHRNDSYENIYTTLLKTIRK